MPPCVMRLTFTIALWVKVTSNPTLTSRELSKVELEFATVYDIAEELAKRGLQFVIAIEKTKKKDSDQLELDLCVDGGKNLEEMANVLAPYFGMDIRKEADGY